MGNFGGPREKSAAERAAERALGDGLEKACVVCGRTSNLELVRTDGPNVTICREFGPCLALARALDLAPSAILG